MFAIMTIIKNKTLYLKRNNTDLRFTDKLDESYKFDSKEVKKLLKKLKINQPHLEFKKYRIPKKYCLEIVKIGNHILRNKVPYNVDLINSIDSSNRCFVKDSYENNIDNYVLMSDTETFRNLFIDSVKENYYSLSRQFYGSFESEKFKTLTDWKVSIIYVDSLKEIQTLDLYTLKNEPILKNSYFNSLHYQLDFQINSVNLVELNRVLKNNFKSRLVKVASYYGTKSKYVISEKESLIKTHSILQRKRKIFFIESLSFHEEPMFLKFMFFELAHLVTHLLKQGLSFQLKFEEVK